MKRSEKSICLAIKFLRSVLKSREIFIEIKQKRNFILLELTNKYTTSIIFFYTLTCQYKIESGKPLKYTPSHGVSFTTPNQCQFCARNNNINLSVLFVSFSDEIQLIANRT